MSEVDDRSEEGPATVTYDRSGFHAVGRLPMHSVRRAPEIDLDGNWDFQLRMSPDAPLGPEWSTVTVPGLWTMTDPADPPHYTNVPMPFDEVPPQIPVRNPTGVYRRSVALAPVPGRRVILHVGAAEGLLTARVNGRLVGTSTDSHLAAEFDITEACAPGPNEIELAVAKWSSVSYLEDQDHWWHGGLSRPVFIYSVPDIRLADLSVVADFDAGTGRGSLRLTASTEGLTHLADTAWLVEVDVLGRTVTAPVAPRFTAPSLPRDTPSRSVRPDPLVPPDFMELFSVRAAGAPLPSAFRDLPDSVGRMPAPDGLPGTATVALDDLEVRPWSAERPHLEDLVVRLISPVGEVVDSTTARIGFRRVEIVGRDLLVNGGRPLIQGVNRHDIHPRTGRVLTRHDLLAELSLLKRCNVNAIRTSHYPNDPVFLDLCDEIGFYVVDEADIETHAFAPIITHDPRYLGAFVDRVSRMVLRDRNHPCVIAWSLGNESGYGANHDAAAGWLRRFEPTRPLHYEGAISEDWHGGHSATDIVCPMYASFAALEGYANDPRADRPLILCEYAYSQGNSTGGLGEYWDLFESTPGLQGGFIWEFKDHALDPDGSGRYRYGGDFGDEPNDGIVCLNGVAFADAVPKPALFEARGIFSPVRIVSDASDGLRGRLRLRNRRSFADLDDLRFEARVETVTGPLPAVTIEVPPVAAGRVTDIELPAGVAGQLASDDALALTLLVLTREGSIWSEAGTVIGEHQVRLPLGEAVGSGESGAPPAARRSSRPELDPGGDLVHPLLKRPPRLCLWRAMTDNDMSFSLDNRFVRTGFFRLDATSVDIADEAGGVVVTTTYATAWGDPVVHRRTVTAVQPGDWVLAERVELPEGTTDGLRVGVELELVEGFDGVEWVGLGPWENYPDRRRSALLGRWSLAIEDLAVPYVKPQEHGGRGGVRELVVSGPAGTVVTTHPDPVQMNVGRHSIDDLETAAHWWELPTRPTTTVHLDIAHRGLGTGLLGPDTRPQYRLSGDRYEWTWQLTMSGNRLTPSAGPA